MSIRSLFEGSAAPNFRIQPAAPADDGASMLYVAATNTVDFGIPAEAAYAALAGHADTATDATNATNAVTAISADEADAVGTYVINDLITFIATIGNGTLPAASLLVTTIPQPGSGSALVNIEFAGGASSADLDGTPVALQAALPAGIPGGVQNHTVGVCKVVANGTPYLAFVSINSGVILLTLSTFAVWPNGPFQVDAFSVCYLAYPPP